jgi:hypothetical protein
MQKTTFIGLVWGIFGESKRKTPKSPRGDFDFSATKIGFQAPLGGFGGVLRKRWKTEVGRRKMEVGRREAEELNFMVQKWLLHLIQ